MLLNILQCIGQLPQGRIIQLKMSIWLKLKNSNIEVEDGQLVLPTLSCFEDKKEKDVNVLGIHKLV